METMLKSSAVNRLRPVREWCAVFRLVAACMLATVIAWGPAKAGAEEPVVLVRGGVAMQPILVGESRDAAERLRDFIARISGAEMAIEDADPQTSGVYVGLRKDFPWIAFPDIGDLGPEGYLIRSADQNLFLIGDQPMGVEIAVTTFQRKLGLRQFFPGDTWRVEPSMASIAGNWHATGRPDYHSQRRLWYGFGAYPPGRADLAVWNRKNRMGGPEPVSIGHTWYGIPRTDEFFEEHPEWFALVERDGEMQRRRSKPCYRHPDVIEHIVQYTVNAARAGRRSVSLSPPDGLGYCECDRCHEVFQGGEPERAHGTLFAVRPDGLKVNIVSETLFAVVNRAAEAVAEEFPDFIIGCYAYSAYSHPTSFDLHPMVYIQTTTAYRRTPLTLEEQLVQWGKRARQVGIREYWSVYQWDWDNPDPGKMRPDRQARDLRFYHDNNVVAMNAEASNNWGPRGLGYYLAAQLLWDLDADIQALLEDFYHAAFGAAAPAMERYYARWYGPSVVVGLDERSAVIAARSAATDDAEVQETDELTDHAPVFRHQDREGTRRTLAATFADLDDAVRLSDGDPAARGRVDHLRFYTYYLYLRWRVWEAVAAGDEAAILAAIEAETRFGGRLTNTHVIHARPLIGKAFHRRFRGQMNLLQDIPEAQTWGEGWRSVGEAPSPETFEELWSQARAEL